MRRRNGVHDVDPPGVFWIVSEFFIGLNFKDHGRVRDAFAPFHLLFDPHLLLCVCQVLVQKDGFQGRPSFVDGQEVFAPIVRRASSLLVPWMVTGIWMTHCERGWA